MNAEPPLAAAPLYALPPDEFVPAREALARQLAEARDPLAAAVRKLRRPVGLAWILNHLAQAEPDKLEILFAAADHLRAAQAAALEGEGAGGLREAEEQVRTAARALRLAAAPVLARASRAPAPVTMAHLEVLLRALATAPDELRARFRKGLLDREPDLGGGVLGGFPTPASPGKIEPRTAPTPAPPAKREPPRADRDERAREVREREEERERRRAEQARRREEAEARARERERAKRIGEARRALAQAKREVEKRRAALRAAQEVLDAARAELEDAEAEARRRRELLDRIGGASGGAREPETPAPSEEP